MQIVTLLGTRSAVATGKLLYRAEMSVGSLSYTRDLLRVALENPLVPYPILDPCMGAVGVVGVGTLVADRKDRGRNTSQDALIALVYLLCNDGE